MASSSPDWRPAAGSPHLYRAVWLLMIAMSSFFLAMTCAYLAHNGAPQWLTPELARVLSANTALLVASSLALVRARQFFRWGRPGRPYNHRATLGWTITAFGFGCAFLAGQAWAWRLLLEGGVFIWRWPNSGFFYLITAAHAAHLTVGLGLLAYLVSRIWRGRLHSDRPYAMDLTSIVWHCLAATWCYLYLVLLLYR